MLATPVPDSMAAVRDVEVQLTTFSMVLQIESFLLSFLLAEREGESSLEGRVTAPLSEMPLEGEEVVERSSAAFDSLEDILKAVKQGDTEAFEYLPEKLKQKIYFFVWVADGCYTEDNYGEKALKVGGFSRFNQVFPPLFSPEGGTLFEQLISLARYIDRCIREKKMIVSLELIKTQLEARKPPHEILKQYEKLPEAEKEFLRYQVYLADPRDDRLKIENFGKKRIQEDPYLILPHLPRLLWIKQALLKERLAELNTFSKNIIPAALESQTLSDRSMRVFCRHLDEVLKPPILMQHGIYVNGPLYQRLGAHFVGEKKVTFSLYAPGATRVDIQTKNQEKALVKKGDFFEITLEEIEEGDYYQYFVTSRKGEEERRVYKQDPFAFGVQRGDESRGIVRKLDFSWTDDLWVAAQVEESFESKPMNIFQVHLQSFKRKEDGSFFNYRELAPILSAHCKENGFTHVQFLPLNASRCDASWGYQGCNSFAPNSRFGSLQDLQYLINQLHRSGIGVGFDAVPFHFDRDEAFLKEFGGKPFYEKGSSSADLSIWNTYVFDFSNREVKDYLLSQFDFLARVLHADVIRVDAVWDIKKEEEGTEFLKELTAYMEKHHPAVVLVAEDDDKHSVVGPREEGNLGFAMQWDTFFWDRVIEKIYAETFDFYGMIWEFDHLISSKKQLVISHDIIGHRGNSLKRFGKDSFRYLQLMLSLAHAYPGKKLQFMTLFDWDSSVSLEEPTEEESKINKLASTLNALYLERGGAADFDHLVWVHRSDVFNSTLAFMSKKEESARVFIFNFSDKYIEDYHMPFEKLEESISTANEVFNTDAAELGGKGRVNEAVSILPSRKKIAFNMPPRGACFIDVNFT